MRRYTRTRRSRRGRIFSSLVPSFFLVVFGAFGFYGALQWFRADAPATSAMSPEAQAVDEIQDSKIKTNSIDPETQDSKLKTSLEAQMAQVATTGLASVSTTVPLVSSFDGQRTGKVDRYTLSDGYEFYLLAYLPNLDTNLETYHVWLLKDGLADVRDVGELTLRADGSWVSHIVANTMTGFSSPETYASVVIMKTPHQVTSATLSQKIAEAKF